VHITSRLQDLTKECGCKLVVSETVGIIAGIPLGDFPKHEVQVRGLTAPLEIRIIDSAAKLNRYELATMRGGTERDDDPPRRPILAAAANPKLTFRPDHPGGGRSIYTD
jgi:hypothetical protein